MNILICSEGRSSTDTNSRISRLLIALFLLAYLFLKFTINEACNVQVRVLVQEHVFRCSMFCFDLLISVHEVT